MEIRTGSLSFPRARGSGPRTDRTFFNFSRPVRQAVAALTGKSFGFSPRDDHHLGLVNIRLATTIDEDVVVVEGTFGVRDWSNEWDDDYEGTLQFILLAELDEEALPSNLAITGVEYSQAIQFFRSRLDPATAEPDNSISLIAGKDTVLRVYVDTQSDPTRPTIALVSGLLEIRLSGSGTFIPIAPLNAPIAPRLDSEIQRNVANHTLNFLIPAAFATDEITFRVRAFEAAHPDQPGYMSGFAQNRLRFVEVRPLGVRGVGVNYTGTTPVPAPNVADLRNTLSFVSQTYPVGQVVISGFDVIDFNGDLTDTSGDGCGAGWDDLLSRLRDMRGDSRDIYYAIVPAAVPTGGVIGCGGGGVGAGMVFAGPTAAQEIGHAFGRHHAPCGNPPNVDENYPVYDALPSGSIGEVGINAAGQTRDPTFTSDFMSYCGPAWVSPYTYDGLRRAFPPVTRLVAVTALDETAERRSLPTEHLFLNFRIYRGGWVEVLPSFHYPALPAAEEGRLTPYAIELRNADDRTLNARRARLTNPHKDLDSAVLEFFERIPFDPNTACIVFTCSAEGDCEQKELLAMKVRKKSPALKIISPSDDGEISGEVRVKWKVTDYEGGPISFLVRYSNDGGQSWLATAPPLQANEHVVNLDRLPGGEKCQFQVLATSGIRTGAAVSSMFRVPLKVRSAMIASPPSGTVVAPSETVTLIGEVFSPDGGSAPPSELRWHSNLDGSLGTGQELRLKTLRGGRHTISLQAPDGLGGETSAAIELSVEAPIPLTHTSRTQPDHSSIDHDTGKTSRY